MTTEEFVYPFRRNSNYLFSPELAQSCLPYKSKNDKPDNITIPLVCDTEFQTLQTSWLNIPSQSRLGIISQWRHINGTEGKILAHTDLVDVPEAKPLLDRYPLATSGFHAVDFLQLTGIDILLSQSENPSDFKSLPKCDFKLYAHFALAEILMIATGKYKEDIKDLLRSKSAPMIEMGRRLKASGGKSLRNGVALPWIVTINGVKYQVCISIVDTGALHGVASYNDLCIAAGIKPKYKDLLTKKDKENMLMTAINRPDDFENYALGDLYVYDLLKANAKNFRKIYKDLGLNDYYTAPSLTIGSTIQKLFLPPLLKYCDIPSLPDNKNSSEYKRIKGLHEELQSFVIPASAEYLKQSPIHTISLGSKVEGGRCRNNRPLDIFVVSALANLDISGCYGEGQRNQEYPLGNPEVINYDVRKENKYLTLREFLEMYGIKKREYSQWNEKKHSDYDLVPGLWLARITTNEELKISQDVLASWYVSSGNGCSLHDKYLARMAKFATEEMCDSEEIETEQDNSFNLEDGNLKVLNNEIINGVITHDFLDWLFNIASTQQRNELLDKTNVLCSIVYPRSWRVNSYKELVETYDNWNEKNTVKRVAVANRQHKKIFSEDGNCHAWFSVNLGDLIINKLLVERKRYPKIDEGGTKNPMNTLYKLCGNTLYGVMVSKYFTTSNVVVGNNITARARLLAWYMEKGLYGFQTVTDGTPCELNRVPYPRRENRMPKANDFVNFYQQRNPKDIVLKPIDNAENIDLIRDSEGTKLIINRGDTIEILVNSEASEWINRVSFEHLQMLFPEVDVLHKESTKLKVDKATGNYTEIPRIGQFEFEVKDFHNYGVFHSSSNYMFDLPNDKVELKMRSYETKRSHDSVVLDSKNNLLITDKYGDNNNPALDFMCQLRDNPSAVKRQEVFVKNGLLKVSQYKENTKLYDRLGVEPGDNIFKPGLLRELSLSQFTFRTVQQRNAWEKEIDRMKDKTGQSLEKYFTNVDGTLNYSQMINTIDKLIHDYPINPKSGLPIVDDNKTFDSILGGINSESHPMFDALNKVKSHLRRES